MSTLSPRVVLKLKLGRLIAIGKAQLFSSGGEMPPELAAEAAALHSAKTTR